MDNVKVKELNFSPRLEKWLVYAGIETVDQLCGYTRDDILRIPNIGISTLVELKRKLCLFDLELGRKPLAQELVKLRLRLDNLLNVDGKYIDLRWTIHELRLTARSEDSLLKNGVKKISELIALNDSKLQKLSNLEQKSILEIQLKREKILRIIKSSEELNSTNQHFKISDLSIQSLNILRASPLDGLGLPVRALRVLYKIGVHNCYDFSHLDVNNFSYQENIGRNTQNIVDMIHKKLIFALRSNPEFTAVDELLPDWTTHIEKSFVARSSAPSPVNLFASLSIDAKNIYESYPVTLLGLSVRSTNALNNIGIEFCGQLFRLSLLEISQIEAVGKKSTQEISKLIVAISSSANINGHISLTEFNSKRIDTINIPSVIATSSSFQDAFEIAIEEISDNLSDTDNYIFQNRLCCKERKKTLQYCSDNLGITRERVRQLESRILVKLRNIFCEGAAIRFPGNQSLFTAEITFINFWLEAIQLFSKVKEIDNSKFVSAISEAWGVNKEFIIKNINFLLAIFTGNNTLDCESFRTLDLSDAPFGNHIEATPKLSIAWLRPNKKDKYRLEKGNIKNLRDIRDNWPLPDYRGKKDFVARISKLENCFTNAGEIDKNRYIANFNLIDEIADIASPKQYFNDFRTNVLKIFEFSYIPRRAIPILENRIFPVPDDRKTIATCAQMLPQGSSALVHTVTKREILPELSRILVHGDYSSLIIWIPISITKFSRLCLSSYKTSNQDYNIFVEELARQFSLETEDVENAAPTLWATFQGGVADPYRAVRKREIVNKVKVGSVIKLSGFRKIH